MALGPRHSIPCPGILQIVAVAVDPSEQDERAVDWGHHGMGARAREVRRDPTMPDDFTSASTISTSALAPSDGRSSMPGRSLYSASGVVTTVVPASRGGPASVPPSGVATQLHDGGMMHAGVPMIGAVETPGLQDAYGSAPVHGPELHPTQGAAAEAMLQLRAATQVHDGSVAHVGVPMVGAVVTPCTQTAYGSAPVHGPLLHPPQSEFTTTLQLCAPASVTV